jgi:hypothetical protein
LQQYSHAHLVNENPYRFFHADDLAQELDALRQDERDENAVHRRLAARLRLQAPNDRAADSELLVKAILLGNGIGLGASFGGISEAELLWAGAARLLEQLGIAHPNELIDE